MELYGIKTPIISQGDNLIEITLKSIIEKELKLQEKDVLVFAETVIGTTQNRIVKYEDIGNASEIAKKLALKYKMDEKFVQLIVEEANLILGGVEGVLLTEKDGVLIANAGIDQSNSGGEGNFSLYPLEPQKTAEQIRNSFLEKLKIKNLGIIIADSRVQPMRRGVIGVAIGVSGFEPIEDYRGKKDLFGRELKITTKSVADDLTTAAELIMGEGDEQTPIVLIRNAPILFIDRKIDYNELLIPRNECLFMNVFKDLQAYKKPEYSKKD